jgi:thiol-disulfide isomerase/thioredoxin
VGNRRHLYSVFSSLIVLAATVFAIFVYSKRYIASLAPDFPFDAVRGNYMPYKDNFDLTAPEFPSGFTWINSRALSLKELRGNVVLLDFWTYCCINCMHVIPDLKYLEEKYKDKPFVVIGIHAAKFDNEESDGNIRNAVMRYGIEHPVLVDQGMRIWDAYTISSWPSFVVIAPDGQLAVKLAGEGQRAALDETIASLLDEYRKRGLLASEAPSFNPEKPESQTGLLYPGKVVADTKNDRVFISDTGHNRVVVTNLHGQVIDIIGSGNAGVADGGFREAEFNNPEGLEFDGEKLYLADTGNNLIRLANLSNKTVTTIAGNAAQMNYGNTSGGNARETAISSPWDLKLVDDKLYIAAAGRHMIYELDFVTGKLFRYAGNGYEARQDGSRMTASFAQPSGLTFLNESLYVADSEISSIREINLRTQQVITTVGGDLFDFGDTDGVGDEARLQHPLGVTAYDNAIFVADSYNHKIKRLDPSVKFIRTFAGDGNVGYRDGSLLEAEFNEPGGLYASDGLIYVADTNNHQIRVIDIGNETVHTFEIKGLQ